MSIPSPWLDVLGWGGSALLVFSLMQTAVLRFRVLNLAASLILLAFNALLGIWPMVALNAALSLINAWFLVRLLRQRDDDTVYTVLEASPTDAYLRHVLDVHANDIAHFQPNFEPQSELADPNCHTFLIQNRDETVGVIVVRVDGGTANIRLDYVTARYRDFSPGKFVWRRSALLTNHGVSRVVSHPQMVGAYYDRLGFRHEGDSWVLDLSDHPGSEARADA